MQKSCKVKNGFTLVELLVAIFSFSFLALGIYALVSNVFVTSNRQGAGLGNLDMARKVAYGFTSAVRAASYSDGGAYPLQTGTAQALTLYANIDQSADVERVRYYLSGGVLYMGIIKPSGNPPSYNQATEQVYPMVKDVVNGANPVFYYYNGDYAGPGLGNPLAEPVLLTEVKYIKMQLQVRKDSSPKTTGYYTLTAGGAIRNLKTNLGD